MYAANNGNAAIAEGGGTNRVRKTSGRILVSQVELQHGLGEDVKM